jgi:hypothetical protein
MPASCTSGTVFLVTSACHVCLSRLLVTSACCVCLLRLLVASACCVCLLRPKSVGEIQLRNANPQGAPLIDLEFLDDPQDLEEMVMAFKITRKLLETPALLAYNKHDIPYCPGTY